MTLISVLCPTRERPALLEASVAGLRDLATDPDAVEILIAVDPDDETMAPIATAPRGFLYDCPVGLVWIAPERYGYAHLEEYYNRLAEMAKGEWLFIWNDDATMETPGWDAIIAAQPPGFLWAAPCNPEAEPWMPSEFPVVPAAWFRHLGHLALHHSVDMWLGRVGLATGTGIHIPVTIDHCVCPRDTSRYPSFHATEMEEARRLDAARLMELLG